MKKAMQIRDLQENWNEFGKSDPLWAILTLPGKRGNKWDPAEFFATGVQEVDDLLVHLKTLGITAPTEKALDFGCGVGRLTQALAHHFDSAVGVDIAPSMLALAKQYNRHGDRCTFVLNESDDLRLFGDDVFSFIYSNYTLQHMQPEYAKRYIEEFVRVLQPGGVMVFQLPAAAIIGRKERLMNALPRPLLRLYARLRHGKAAAGPVMETHVVPQTEVVRTISRSGAEVVKVEPNPKHDIRWTSLLYYAVKPRPRHD